MAHIFLLWSESRSGFYTYKPDRKLSGARMSRWYGGHVTRNVGDQGDSHKAAARGLNAFKPVAAIVNGMVLFQLRQHPPIDDNGVLFCPRLQRMPEGSKGHSG